MPGWGRQKPGGKSLPQGGERGAGARLRAVPRAMRQVRRLERGDGTSESGRAVHALRVSCRRAAAVLEVTDAVVPAKGAGRLERMLRQLRREAGSVRNADVHMELLGALLEAGGEHAEGVRRVMREVARERGRAWTRLRRLASPERRARLSVRVERAVGAWKGVSITAPARARLSQLVAEALVTVQASMHDASQLHLLRIVLKRVRYTAELLLGREEAGEAGPAPVRWLLEAQRRLGDVNDVATLVSRLRGMGAGDLAADAGTLRERFEALEARRLSQAAEWARESEPERRLAELLALAGVEAPAHEQPELARPTTGGVAAGAPARTVQAGAPQRSLFLAGQRIAVIDVGSNGIRLLAVELNDERSWNVLAEERATARLAEGQGRRRELCPQAMARAVEAIQRFKGRCDALGCSVRAFATAAVRDASNRGDFVSLVKDRTGLDLSLISEMEEGKYTYAAVARRYDLSHGLCAVVDIGGGSVEVVLSQRGVVVQNSSVPLGAVRLTELFGGPDAVGRERYRELRAHVDRALGRGVERPAGVPAVVVGCGGTFTTMLTVAAAMRGVPIERNSPALRTLGPVSRAQLQEIIARLRVLPLAERLRVPGLPPDRADIVVAGLVVVDRLMRHLGVSQVHANSGGVREGLLTRLIAERVSEQEAESTRDARMVASARRFAEGCGYERGHSETVAALALRLYDLLLARGGLVPGLGGVPHERAVLEAAGVLHDVGIMVEYRRHHKHSATIVRHADLAHWDARLQEVLAQVCRYHRRAGPRHAHAPFAALGETDRALVRRLSGILRVADGLDRSHAGIVQDVHVRADGRRLRIAVVSGADAGTELRAARDKSGVLEAVAGRRVVLEPVAQAPDAGEVVVKRRAPAQPVANGRVARE